MRPAVASSTAVRASRATVCAFAESLKPYVLRASGFQYAVERNKQGLPKPGYVATSAGAELDLCFEPELPSSAKLERLAGTSGVAKGRAAWSLGYLMSYEHMGVARGECLSKRAGSSCSCPPREFNARWKRQVSQPHISRLMVLLKYAKTAAGTWAAARGKLRSADAGGCSCVIRLTVLNTSVDATHGHKFKLTSLMRGFYTGNLVGQAAQWAADYDLI